MHRRDRHEIGRRLSLPALGISLLLALAAGNGLAVAEQRHIFLDGYFTDWDGLAPLWVDPSGDGGPSGIDFGAIWAADTPAFFHLSFEVGCDLILQESNSLSLYIDTDDNPATGFPVNGIGAELRWIFGQRGGFFFRGSEWVAIGWRAIGLASGPTYSGDRFEITIDRDACPDGVNPLFTGPLVRFVLQDGAGGGDWAPGAGASLSYIFDQGSLDPLPEIDLSRGAPDAARLVTYNVLSDGLFNSGKQPAFSRILRAIDPDVIAFQEIYNHTAAQTRALIESWLGGAWSAVQVSDKVLLSRSAIIDDWSIAGGRAGAFLIEPAGGFGDDLLIVNAHLSCCSNDAARQQQVDAIMAFVRDARTSGGEIDLAPANPIIITGDMNFVGLNRQLETLLSGDIADETTYGPDFRPDWDDTDNRDLVSRQPMHAPGYTWYQEDSDYSPGRLDFIIYTDSNMHSARNLILQTSVLPSEFLNEYGLLPNDTDTATDHLPSFADFVPGAGGAVEEPIAWPSQFVLLGPNPACAPITFELRMPDGAPAQVARLMSVHDAAGRRVRSLSGTQLGGGIWRYTWDGRFDSGSEAPSGAYWLVLPNQRGPAQRVIVVR